MINENNFLKIGYSLLTVQFLTVLVIFFITDISTVFYYLPLGIGIIVLYIPNKKSKIEKINNIKFHKTLIGISAIFLFFVSHILYNWRN
jgi:hypothetical protein